MNEPLTSARGRGLSAAGTTHVTGGGIRLRAEPASIRAEPTSAEEVRCTP
jgi:hypothetical protein